MRSQIGFYQFRLQAALAKTNLDPDTIVLIDCPPSLGILSVKGLAAADRLLVAVHPGRFELDGLKRLEGTVDRIRQKINPQLETAGIVLCNSSACDASHFFWARIVGRAGAIAVVVA